MNRYIKHLFNKLRVEKITPITVPVLSGNLLLDRKALITGGNRGIGFAIADAFIKNGASVIITGRNKEALLAAKTKLISENNCPENSVNFFVIDNSQEINEDILRTFLIESGKIDILVNNAGIMNGCDYFDCTQENFDNVISTNLKSTFFISQVFSKYMIDNKIPGNILNICSSSCIRPGDSPYVLSKWSMRALTLGLAEKLLPYNIIVNGLAPGPTATDMLGKTGNNSLFLKTKPLGRFILPEEIANLAVVLVSKLGTIVVGDTLFATGGSALLTQDISYKHL